MNRRKFIKFAGVGVCAIPAVGLLSGCPSAEQWITTIDEDLPTLSQIVDTTLIVVATASGAPILTPVIQIAIAEGFKLVHLGLQVTEQVLADYKANPTATTLQKVQIAVKDILDKANAILQIAVPQGPQQSVIASAVASIVSVVSSILLLIPVAKTAQNGKAVQPSVVVPNKKQVRAAYNASLRANGYAQLQVN